MALRYDIQLGSDGDLPLEANKLQLAPSDRQHIDDIIETGPGQWKQFPTNGFLVMQYLGSSGKQEIANKNLKSLLNADGYTVGPALVSYLLFAAAN